METINLNVHPQILDLYEALEQNGLHKQKEEVQSLVGYIENMEYSLSVMMSEIQEMHSEVKQIHDSGLHAKCTRLLDSVQDKVEQTKNVVLTVKTNFIRAAGNAVKIFKEKGRTALLQAVNAMKIPAVLSHMKNGFQLAAQSMQEAAGKVDVKREQLHEAGSHLKNAGRTLLGRPAKQLEKLEADKGVLAKVRKFFESFEKAFSGMEKGAASLSEKLRSDRQPEEKKSSVKSELQVLKSAKTAKKNAPVIQEQTR